MIIGLANFFTKILKKFAFYIFFCYNKIKRVIFIETYTYDKETGTSTYTIKYKNMYFIGKATIHPEDRDYMNEYTGLTIAHHRAILNRLFFQEQELKTQIEYIYHLISLFHISNSHLNINGKEFQLIKKQLKIKQKSLQDIKEKIKAHKNFLKEFITGKDQLYKRLRKNKQ